MKYILERKPRSQQSEFPVKNEYGETVLKVEESSFLLRKRISIKDQYAIEIGFIKKKLLASAFTYEIYHEKELQATMKKGSWFFRKRYRIVDKKGNKYTISGDVANYEYLIKAGRRTIAVVSKDLSPRSETYGIEIGKHGSPYICICAALIIDAINKPLKLSEPTLEDQI